MNLQQLKYFEVVARVQHMTQAANLLHMAQPALSKTIRTLEEDLGVPLFDRRGRNIILNENGVILLKYAELVERELSLMAEDVKKAKMRENKSVTILLKSTPLLVVQLVRQFRTEHPDIVVRLLTYNRNTQTSDLHYDFWIDSSIRRPSGDCSLTLLEEPLVLAVTPDSAYSGRELDLSDAKNEDFVSLPSQSSQGQEFIGICKQAGFLPNIILQSSDYNTIREMVAAQMGVAIAPRYSWGLLRSNLLSFAPIVSPPCSNYISLNWSGTPSISSSGRAFINFTQRTVESGDLAAYDPEGNTH